VSARYGVVFDMDGVLVDSYRAHFQSWQALGAEHGLAMSEAQFAATFGHTSREVIARFWGAGLNEAQVRRLDARKEALFRRLIARDLPVIPGALSLIDALHAAGVPLAVGSSGPPENVALVLDGLARRDRFRAVITGRDVARGRPDPEVFLKAAGALGLPPARCAVIEDAPDGIAAAKAAGSASVALVHPYHPRAAFADADACVERLSELTPARLRALVGP